MIHESAFKGADYQESKDFVRLSGQIKDIYDLMSDHQWRTVEEIRRVLEFKFREAGKIYPDNSIQAQLRNLRKPDFGSYEVLRRRRGKTNESEYQVLAPLPSRQLALLGQREALIS